LLTALLSVTALKDSARGLAEGEYWVLLLSSAAGAALLPAPRYLAAPARAPRAPPPRLARPRHPRRRPGGRLAARVRPRRPAPRRPEVLRGGPESLPLLCDRDRRHPHGHQLPLRHHRPPLPHRDRRPRPARGQPVP